MVERQIRVASQIRELILSGALAAGERLAEAALAERLGVSRTPVRQALPVLAQEGLLAEAGARGYLVRGFSAADILDAIDLRGALEGMAARRIAEHGPSPALLAALKQSLASGDRVLAMRADGFAQEEEAAFADLNGRFHDLIVEAANSAVIAEAIQRVNGRPFVDPRAIAFEEHDAAHIHQVLSYAHRQHHAVVEALETRAGARVEALMREHVQPVKDATNLLSRIERANAPQPRRAGLRHG